MGILDSLIGKDQPLMQPFRAAGGMLSSFLNNWASPTQAARPPGAKSSPVIDIQPNQRGMSNNQAQQLLPSDPVAQGKPGNQQQQESLLSKAIQSLSQSASPREDIAASYRPEDEEALNRVIAEADADPYAQYLNNLMSGNTQNPSPTSALPTDKTELLSNLKNMAATVFPDNPVMQQVALSQAIHESGLMGTPSQLASKNNNYFGIKESRSFPGTGGTVDYDHTEYVGGQPSRMNAGFSSNLTPEDSFRQYQRLMTGASRYQPVLQSQNPEQAFDALQRSGYATDPAYAKKLARVYSQYVSPLYQG